MRADKKTPAALSPGSSGSASGEADMSCIYRWVASTGQVTWLVSLRWNKIKCNRSFSERQYGGAQIALQEARQWRDAKRSELMSQHPHRSLVAMRASAQAAGVTCLDTQWLGGHHAYRFRCASGHEWQRTATSQQKTPHCPACTYARISQAYRQPHKLAEIHEMAQGRGGQCLSHEYTGVAGLYRFRCAAGHEWESRGHHVLDGRWCSHCAYATRRGKPRSQETRQKIHQALRLSDGLQRLERLAVAKGGQCLSDQYLGSLVRHGFRCAKGHEWQATAASVVSGKWCATCRDDALRLTLADAQQAAHARGGRCLSTSYVNGRTPMQWECDRGHVWTTCLEPIRLKGTWCPDCAHMAQVSNRKSKAMGRYVDAGKHLVGEISPESEAAAESS